MSDETDRKTSIYGTALGTGWMRDNRWDRWPDSDVGILNDVTPQLIMEALRIPRQGKIYDLEVLRFKGMPVWEGHSGWDIISYGSHDGRKTMKEGPYDHRYNWYGPGGYLNDEQNAYHTSINSEVVIGPLHVGTHIDSLGHYSVGEDQHWWNGFTEKKDMCSFGLLRADASTIPPIILRGVMLDIPAYKGRPHLNPQEGITADDVQGCAEWAGVAIKEGDAILLRTGLDWPGMRTCPGAGITLEAAMYLVKEKNVYLIGDDQVGFEVNPPDARGSFPGHIDPVHHFLLIQNGVHVMELVNMEELSRDKVYEFCFVCSVPKIKGATGMMVRPLAII